MSNKRLFDDKILFADGHFGSFNPSLLLTERNIVIPDSTSPEFMMGSMKFSATTVHEDVHWFQFIGTNYGRLLLLMAASRTNLFYRDDSIEIIRQFVKDKPEIMIEENWSLNAMFAKGLPERSALLLQDWMAHSIAYNFLLNGNADFQEVADLSNYISTALAFTFVCTNNFLGGDRSIQILDIENKLSFPDFGIPRVSGDILTVNHLLEGAAKVADLFHQDNFPLGDRSYRENTFYGNDNNLYWKAWNVFVMIYVGNNRKVTHEELIVLFSVLVEVALAIPFPPFAPLETLGQFTWYDLYPPIRFIKLCESAASIPLEIVPKDLAKMQTVIEKVAHSAGYPTPLELDTYFLKVYKSQLKVIENKWMSKKRDFRHIELFDYYLFLFKQTAEMRLQSPFAIANIAVAHTMPAIGDLLHVYLNMNEEYPFITSSPLMIDINKKVRKLYTPFGEKDSDVYQWILCNLVSQKVITEYLIFGRPVRSADFPFDVPGFVKDEVKRHIHTNFDYLIEWVE